MSVNYSVLGEPRKPPNGYKNCKHWYHMINWDEMPQSWNYLKNEYVKAELIALGKKTK